MKEDDKKEIKGTVVFVFQPDEEDAGAEWMINEGALEHPKPDALSKGYVPKNDRRTNVSAGLS